MVLLFLYERRAAAVFSQHMVLLHLPAVCVSVFAVLCVCVCAVLYCIVELVEVSGSINKPPAASTEPFISQHLTFV